MIHLRILVCLLQVFRAADNFNDGLDSLLEVQRDRAGSFAAAIFEPLDHPDVWGLDQQESTDLRFLTAYLPLGDLAVMDGASLVENVQMAREAVRRFSWGKELSEGLYRHFVLPHRISQEPFVPGWRKSFLEQLTPRVKGLTMEQAALEVNHWCHEVATFKQTTGRDQDPMTTIRTGYGRCEEEMILAIAALRSIGIPARQCYTPYWPHTDNNHAWVEVWVDGKWYYLGACEPKLELGDAWFTRSAARAMLVVSTAYGDYRGDEPVLRRYDRSTLINSTAVYGKTRDLTVTLLDPRGKSVKDKPVLFSLFNYGGFMPALALHTDQNGVCRVVCGRGDWIITAGDEKRSAVFHCTADDDDVTLQLSVDRPIEQFTSVDYTPPPPPPRNTIVSPDIRKKRRKEKPCGEGPLTTVMDVPRPGPGICTVHYLCVSHGGTSNSQPHFPSTFAKVR